MNFNERTRKKMKKNTEKGLSRDSMGLRGKNRERYIYKREIINNDK